MYRPLLLVTYSINYTISGLNPWSYRLFNLLLCALNAALLVTLLRRLLNTGQTRGSDDDVSEIGQTRGSAPTGILGIGNPYYLLAGALFVAHPLTGYCFRLVSTRSALMLTLFVLLGLMAYLHAVEEETSQRLFWFVLSSLFMCFGLLTVSVAVVFPAMVLLVECGRLRTKPLRAAARIAPSAILAVLYIIGRAWILGKPFGEHYVRPVGENLLLQCKAWWLYIGWTFFPIRMPLYVELKESRNLIEATVLLSMLGLLIWMAAGLKLWVSRNRSIGGMFLLWPVVSYLPYAAIPLNLPVAYHHYYLSLAGLTAFCAIYLSGLKRRATTPAIIVLACYATLNYMADQPWQKEILLAGDSVRQKPLSGRAWNDVGLAYAEDFQLDKAVSAYQTALQNDKKLPGVHLNMGIALFYMGQYSESIAHLEYYQTHPPWRVPDPTATGLIGMDLVGLGKYREGMVAIETALEAIPNSTEFLNYKAMALAKMGRIEEAKRTYDKLLGISSDYRDAFVGRAKLALATGDIAGAMKNAEEAQRRFGASPDIVAIQARALIQSGKLDEASNILNAAREKFYDHAELWALSGDALLLMGRKAEALEMYTRAIAMPMAPEEKEVTLQKILEIKKGQHGGR